MEIDGRDSAKCRKSKLEDIDDIIEFVLNDNKTKTIIVSSPTFIKRSQNMGRKKRRCNSHFLCFRVRERDFSLGFWAIRPLEFFGTRRKVALHREAYAWAPILRSFNKRREVEVLSYLSFTLCLSVL